MQHRQQRNQPKAFLGSIENLIARIQALATKPIKTDDDLAMLAQLREVLEREIGLNSISEEPL
jgi:hypothetical protein